MARSFDRITAIDYLSKCGSPTAPPGTVIGPPSLTQALLWDLSGPWRMPRAERMLILTEWAKQHLEDEHAGEDPPDGCDPMDVWARQDLYNAGEAWLTQMQTQFLPRIDEITSQRILPRFPSRIRREAQPARDQYLSPFRWNLFFYLIETGLRAEGMNETFFSRMIDIYEAGRVSCGWRGEYPEGHVIIF